MSVPLLNAFVAGFVKNSSQPKDIDTSVVVDFLQELELSDLPPGGGLPAK